MDIIIKSQIFIILKEEYYNFGLSYGACQVLSLVAAHSLGAQVLPNSCLVNFKQLWHSILKLVLLDVSIHLEREGNRLSRCVVPPQDLGAHKK